jgi:LuxR family transcriptional regulator, maltose regulon positive regulatory protein
MNPGTAGPTPLVRGRDALARAEWEEAREALDAAVAAAPEDAAGWEALGTACMWLQDTSRVLEARQRAYTLYRDAGDDLSSARLCLDLAGDFLELRGEPAVANGWFQRGRRLLEGLPPAREHAILHLWDAYAALLGEGDLDAADAHARRAIAASEAVGAADAAVLALALQGLARVVEGRVAEGMALLDEAAAAAVGGELTDPDLICRTCCCMIDACDHARDYGRAMEWCERLRQVAARWRVQTFLTTCRIKYSGVLLWRGDWAAAEAELESARGELGAGRPGAAAGALVRLAELRRRQGRRGEAEALLEEVGPHPEAAAVRAALAFDAGDAATAADLLATVLRQTPQRARTERVAALELKVRADVARGETACAEEALAELEEIAGVVGTEPVRAAARAACGEVAAAGGDHERARACFEDAAHLLARNGSPYEAARARLALARSLAALARGATAEAEARAALSVLEGIGAEEAKLARTLLEAIGAAAAAPPEPLTRRQLEVLALVAEGLGDREIGERLFISEFTVHRHVANILARLGATSRTAAVARALRSGLL